MDGRPPDRGPPTRTIQDELDSWKAIAAYLKRDVTTVQRWERREGMPVHRHLHDKQGSVYAFCSELDAWSEGRRTATAQNEECPSEQVAQHRYRPPQPPASHAAPPHRPALVVACRTRRDPACCCLGRRTGSRQSAISSGVIRWRTPRSRNSRICPERRRPLPSRAMAGSLRSCRRAMAIPTHGVIEVGSSQYRNLTQGRVPELINPSIRTLGFSPDGKLVTVWSRKPDGSRPDDINILAVPSGGRGTAELPAGGGGGRVVERRPPPRVSHDCAG